MAGLLNHEHGKLQMVMEPRASVRSSAKVVVIRTQAWRTAAVLLLSDLLALSIAGLLSVQLRMLFGAGLGLSHYAELWPLILLFPLAFAGAGMYPGVGLNPAEELRRSSYTLSTVFLVLAAAIYVTKGGGDFSRGVFFMAWVAALAMVPLFRALTRNLWARKPWWGQSVVVMGAGESSRMVLRALAHHPGLGLKAVAVLDDGPARPAALEGVPVLGGLELAPTIAREAGVAYAVVAMPGVPRDDLLELIERHGSLFHHLILIPDLFGFSSLWVTAHDLGGLLGLEIRQRLLQPSVRLLKRSIDLLVAGTGSLAILPLMLLIAGLIRLDSRGPVLYGSWRIGRGGRRFRIWKFRSMVVNADAILEDYLDQNPSFREEWRQTQKLRNDPRITLVGAILRKTSLDELPQLWNVIRGEMSLVGPRPILRYGDEIARYGEQFTMYARVKPGMTGLWQVSGRTNTSYPERVALDVYYARNWSIWLDLYILARTFWVVLFSRGAY